MVVAGAAVRGLVIGPEWDGSAAPAWPCRLAGSCGVASTGGEAGAETPPARQSGGIWVSERRRRPGRPPAEPAWAVRRSAVASRRRGGPFLVVRRACGGGAGGPKWRRQREREFGGESEGMRAVPRDAAARGWVSIPSVEIGALYRAMAPDLGRVGALILSRPPQGGSRRVAAVTRSRSGSHAAGRANDATAELHGSHRRALCSGFVSRGVLVERGAGGRRRLVAPRTALPRCRDSMRAWQRSRTLSWLQMFPSVFISFAMQKRTDASNPWACNRSLGTT